MMQPPPPPFMDFNPLVMLANAASIRSGTENHDGPEGTGQSEDSPPGGDPEQDGGGGVNLSSATTSRAAGNVVEIGNTATADSRLVYGSVCGARHASVNADSAAATGIDCLPPPAHGSGAVDTCTAAAATAVASTPSAAGNTKYGIDNLDKQSCAASNNGTVTDKAACLHHTGTPSIAGSIAAENRRNNEPYVIKVIGDKISKLPTDTKTVLGLKDTTNMTKVIVPTKQGNKTLTVLRINTQKGADNPYNALLSQMDKAGKIEDDEGYASRTSTDCDSTGSRSDSELGSPTGVDATMRRDGTTQDCSTPIANPRKPAKIFIVSSRDTNLKKLVNGKDTKVLMTGKPGVSAAMGDGNNVLRTLLGQKAHLVSEESVISRPTPVRTAQALMVTPPSTPVTKSMDMPIPAIVMDESSKNILNLCSPPTSPQLKPIPVSCASQSLVTVTRASTSTTATFCTATKTVMINTQQNPPLSSPTTTTATAISSSSSPKSTGPVPRVVSIMPVDLSDPSSVALSTGVVAPPVGAVTCVKQPTTTTVVQVVNSCKPSAKVAQSGDQTTTTVTVTSGTPDSSNKTAVSSSSIQGPSAKIVTSLSTSHTPTKLDIPKITNGTNMNSDKTKPSQITVTPVLTAKKVSGTVLPSVGEVVQQMKTILVETEDKLDHIASISAEIPSQFPSDHFGEQETKPTVNQSLLHHDADIENAEKETSQVAQEDSCDSAVADDSECDNVTTEASTASSSAVHAPLDRKCTAGVKESVCTDASPRLSDAELNSNQQPVCHHTDHTLHKESAVVTPADGSLQGEHDQDLDSHLENESLMPASLQKNQYIIEDDIPPTAKFHSTGIASAAPAADTTKTVLVTTEVAPSTASELSVTSATGSAFTKTALGVAASSSFAAVVPNATVLGKPLQSQKTAAANPGNIVYLVPTTDTSGVPGTVLTTRMPLMKNTIFMPVRPAIKFNQSVNGAAARPLLLTTSTGVRSMVLSQAPTAIAGAGGAIPLVTTGTPGGAENIQMVVSPSLSKTNGIVTATSAVRNISMETSPSKSSDWEMDNDSGDIDVGEDSLSPSVSFVEGDSHGNKKPTSSEMSSPESAAGMQRFTIDATGRLTPVATPLIQTIDTSSREKISLKITQSRVLQQDTPDTPPRSEKASIGTLGSLTFKNFSKLSRDGFVSLGSSGSTTPVTAVAPVLGLKTGTVTPMKSPTNAQAGHTYIKKKQRSPQLSKAELKSMRKSAQEITDLHPIVDHDYCMFTDFNADIQSSILATTDTRSRSEKYNKKTKGKTRVKKIILGESELPQCPTTQTLESVDNLGFTLGGKRRKRKLVVKNKTDPAREDQQVENVKQEATANIIEKIPRKRGRKPKKDKLPKKPKKEHNYLKVAGSDKYQDQFVYFTKSFKGRVRKNRGAPLADPQSLQNSTKIPAVGGINVFDWYKEMSQADKRSRFGGLDSSSSSSTLTTTKPVQPSRTPMHESEVADLVYELSDMMPEDGLNGFMSPEHGPNAVSNGLTVTTTGEDGHPKSGEEVMDLNLMAEQMKDMIHSMGEAELKMALENFTREQQSTGIGSKLGDTSFEQGFGNLLNMSQDSGPTLSQTSIPPQLSDLDEINDSDLLTTDLSNMNALLGDLTTSVPTSGTTGFTDCKPSLSRANSIDSPHKTANNLGLVLSEESLSGQGNQEPLEYTESQLDRSELFPDVSAPPAPVPDPMSEFNVPDLCVVTMYWNELPGLVINHKQYVRLVDIHKQILPAKDTGILKKRCLMLGLDILNCADLQRDFLIRYANAAKSKSTWIIAKDSASKLIGFYVNPRSKSTKQASEDDPNHSVGAGTVSARVSPPAEETAKQEMSTAGEQVLPPGREVVKAAQTKGSSGGKHASKSTEAVASGGKKRKRNEVTSVNPIKVKTISPSVSPVVNGETSLSDILPNSLAAQQAAADDLKRSARIRERKTVRYDLMVNGGVTEEKEDKTTPQSSPTSQLSVDSNPSPSGVGKAGKVVVYKGVTMAVLPEESEIRRLRNKARKRGLCLKDRKRLKQLQQKLCRHRRKLLEKQAKCGQEGNSIVKKIKKDLTVSGDMVESSVTVKQECRDSVKLEGPDEHGYAAISTPCNGAKRKKSGENAHKLDSGNDKSEPVTLKQESNGSKSDLPTGIVKPTDDPNNFLHVVHKDASHRSALRGKFQDGKLFVHRFTSTDAACIQCMTCQEHLSLKKFFKHQHVLNSADELQHVTLPQKLELYSVNPTEKELEHWSVFQEKMAAAGNCRRRGSESSAVQGVKHSTDSVCTPKATRVDGGKNSAVPGASDASEQEEASTREVITVVDVHRTPNKAETTKTLPQRKTQWKMKILPSVANNGLSVGVRQSSRLRKTKKLDEYVYSKLKVADSEPISGRSRKRTLDEIDEDEEEEEIVMPSKRRRRSNNVSETANDLVETPAPCTVDLNDSESDVSFVSEQRSDNQVVDRSFDDSNGMDGMTDDTTGLVIKSGRVMMDIVGSRVLDIAENGNDSMLINEKKVA